MFNLIVSDHVHKKVIEIYPVLKTNISFRNLFYYLTHSTNFDKDNYKLLLNSKTLRSFTTYTNIKQLFNDFEKTLNVKIDYTRYDKLKNKCRQLNEFTYNFELMNLINDDWSLNNKYFITKSGIKKIHTKNKDKVIEIVRSKKEYIANEDQQLISNYMIDCKSLQLIVNKNIKDIEFQINNISDNEKNKKELNKRIYKTMNSIFSDYTTRKDCPRLYPNKNNPFYFSREVRKMALKGCYDMDLKSAQLAIFAKVTKAKLLTNLLKSNKSIWQYISLIINKSEQYLQIQKDQWKELIYAITFGAGNKKLEEISCDFKILRKDPLFKEIFKNKNKLKRQIVKDGYMTDAYDSIHYLIVENGKSNIRTLMSYLMKTYELQLIVELFKNKKYSDKYKIVLYQFDGVTVKIHQKDKEEMILNNFKSIIDKKAKELGILTKLEIEKL